MSVPQTIPSAREVALSRPRGRVAPRESPSDRPSVWQKRYSPLILHLSALAIVASVSLLWDDPSVVLRVGGVVCTVVYLALAWIEAHRSRLWLTPLSFYFAWYSVCLGPAAIFIASYLDAGRRPMLAANLVYADDIGRAYVIYLVGSCAFHAGIALIRPIGDEVVLPESPETPIGRFLWAPVGLMCLWAIGVVLRLSTTAIAVFGAAGGIVLRCSLAALCVYVLRKRRERTLFFWLIVFTGTMIEFVLNVRTGSKATIMISFLAVAWLIITEKRYRAWAVPLASLLLLFYLAVVAPVVSQSRTDSSFGEETTASRIFATFSEGSYGGQALSDNLEDFYLRQFEPISVAYIVHEVDRAGLRDGDTLDYLSYAFIPRIFWPDKPGVTRGGWFTRYLGQRSDTSVSMTMTGELYWNFGFLGVALGGALIGLMIGWVWRLASSTPEHEPIAMLCYLNVILLLNTVAEAGTAIVAITYLILFFVPLLWLSRSFGKTSRPKLVDGLSRARRSLR